MTEFVTQELSVGCFIDWKSYLVTELKVESTRYNEADIVTATVVPDGDFEPEIEAEVVVTINDTQVFAGTLYEGLYHEDGAYKIKALDATVTLKNETVVFSNSSTPTLISKRVEYALAQAGVDYHVWLPHFRMVNDGPRDYQVGAPEGEMSVAAALDTFAEWADALWWVDNYNTVNFTYPQTKLVGLDYILSASAGKTTPPYRGVRVIGDEAPAVGDETFETADGAFENMLHGGMPSLERTVAERALVYDGETTQWEVQEGTTQPPVFTVNDKNIKSSEQANAVAQNLITQLQTQLDGGKIEVVGQAEINVLDAVQLPEVMGGDKYLAGSVIHRVNDSDGFTTEIKCEGLLPSQYHEVEGVGNDVTYRERE